MRYRSNSAGQENLVVLPSSGFIDTGGAAAGCFGRKLSKKDRQIVSAMYWLGTQISAAFTRRRFRQIRLQFKFQFEFLVRVFEVSTRGRFRNTRILTMKGRYYKHVTRRCFVENYCERVSS